MDAPPEKEDVRPYLRVSALLEGVGVHVPHVHERDVARGSCCSRTSEHATTSSASPPATIAEPL